MRRAISVGLATVFSLDQGVPMRRRGRLGCAATLILMFVGHSVAHAQGAAQILYARDYVTSGNGSEATPYVSGTGTGGIQEAIDQCGCGVSSQGCTVVLPRGVVKITHAVEVGTKQGGSFCPKEGVIIRGHGSGELTQGGSPIHLAGTTLRVDAGLSGDGAVLRLQGASFSTFSDFAIDGSNDAAIGIEATAEANYSSVTQQNVFSNILIQGVTDAAIQVGPMGCAQSNWDVDQACQGQVSETTWRNILTAPVPVAFRQFGPQTTGMRIEDSNLVCTDRCVEFYNGDAYMSNNFIGNRTAASPRADIWISKSMGDVSLIGNAHESCARAVIEGESGQRYYTTTLVQNRLQHYYCPTGGSPAYAINSLCTSGYCYLVDYDQPGRFSILGGEFFHNDGNIASAARPRLRFQNTYYFNGPLEVNSFGANYFSTAVWDTFPAATVYLNSSDLIGSIFRQTYATTQNIGMGTDYPLTFQSADATYGTKLLGWITPTGKLRLNDAQAGLEFSNDSGSGNVVKLNPPSPISASTTVTLPSQSGTVVVSGHTLTGDVAGTLSASGTSTLTIHDAAVEPSDVNASNASATGLCLTKDSNDQFKWASCDSARYDKVFLPAGTCKAATAGSSIWNTNSGSRWASFACGGTNVYKAYMNFNRNSGFNTSISAYSVAKLPDDWSTGSNIDIKIHWFTTATDTSQAVVWYVYAVCIGSGDGIDPSTGGSSTSVSSTNLGANTENVASVTGFAPSGCGQGELLYLKLTRDAFLEGDGVLATASVLGAELTLKRN